LILEGKNIGFALTGSFCTFDKIIPVIQQLRDEGANVTPIFSEKVQNTDTRFGTAKEIMEKIISLCKSKPILSLVEAEPIGPKKLFDCIVIAPATGNIIAKLANGITDEVVIMAAKAQIRNQKPVVLAVSTNDALGLNAKNLGILLNSKNIFFVPFRQDDPYKKATSLVADFSLVIPTIIEALNNRQIQPLILAPII